MRPTTALAAGLLSLSLLATACGSDATSVGAGPDTTEPDRSDIGVAPDGSGVEVPDRAPDLVGIITKITPFEPVTEDCTPAEDVDPSAAVSSDDPPVCTPDDNTVTGTILVEEDESDPQGGRKISFTVTTDSKITGTDADGNGVGTFAGFAEGQRAESWTGGPCAESYPEQCGLEAIRVTG